MRSHLSARGHSLLSNSLNQHKESLGEFVAVTGQVSLADVTDGDVAAYFRARTRDPVDSTDARRWSPRTAAKHRSALNKFFKFLVKTHQVASNPVEHFELQRFDPAPPIAIDDAFGEVFVHIESRIADSTSRCAALYVLDPAILSFMDGCGLRVSEASRVRSSDIILQDRDLYANLRLKRNKAAFTQSPDGYLRTTCAGSRSEQQCQNTQGTKTSFSCIRGPVTGSARGHDAPLLRVAPTYFMDFTCCRILR